MRNDPMPYLGKHVKLTLSGDSYGFRGIEVNLVFEHDALKAPLYYRYMAASLEQVPHIVRAGLEDLSRMAGRMLIQS